MEFTYTGTYGPTTDNTEQDGSFSLDRVVRFTTCGNELMLSELCDRYFTATLTKPNAQILVGNLQELVNQLKD